MRQGGPAEVAGVFDAGRITVLHRRSVAPSSVIGSWTGDIDERGNDMNRCIAGKWLAPLIIGVGLSVGQTMAQNIGSLLQLMGGMDMVKKLSSNVLESSAKDPRLAGLLGKVDQDAVSPKLADQMCSMLGGGCKAPLSDQQIAAGSSKLDASQTKALGDNFSSSLDKVTSNPLVKEGVSKAIAPKLGGIVGALI
jgi:hypothetical protein